MQIRLWETCKQNNLKFHQNKMKMFRLSWKIVNINFMYVLRKRKPFYIISNLRELPWTVKVQGMKHHFTDWKCSIAHKHTHTETASIPMRYNFLRRRILIALNYCLFYKIEKIYYKTESVFDFNWNMWDWIDICDWARTHSTGIVSISERIQSIRNCLPTHVRL